MAFIFCVHEKLEETYSMLQIACSWTEDNVNWQKPNTDMFVNENPLPSANIIYLTLFLTLYFTELFDTEFQFTRLIWSVKFDYACKI